MSTQDKTDVFNTRKRLLSPNVLRFRMTPRRENTWLKQETHETGETGFQIDNGTSCL